MLALLALTAALVATCVVLGQAVLALCGTAGWRWWSPALGYAVLLIVFGQVVRIPNHQTALLVVVAIAVLGSLALPSVRSALRESGPEVLVLGAGLILLAAVPFFATGRTGILGASVSNDMSQHLAGAFFLRTQDSVLPVAAIGGDLITTGYPLGAHGLAAGLARAFGVGEVRAFAAVTLAVPALTAMAALGTIPAARRAPRWAFALVIGLGYLPAAYLAQGSFKETAQAMLVLAAAAALSDFTREESPPGWRAGVPIGLLAAGGVYTYSYGGAFWIIGTAALVVAVELVRQRHRLGRFIRRVWPAAVGAGLAGAVAVAPEIHRIEKFRNSIFGVEPKTNRGNLFHAINPLETFGLWFTGDFRLNPDPMAPSVILTAIAIAALLAGLPWWWRRSFAIPAAVITATAIWIELAVTRNIYNAAKGLIVVAPVLMTCVGAPLVAAWDRGAGTVRTIARVTAVVLFAGAAVASAGVLRSAPVGLGSHEHELASLRPLLHGKPVLFLMNDHFAEWELRGARPPYLSGPLYSPAHLNMSSRKRGGILTDVDNYSSRELDRVDFILVPGGAYQSEIPPNFRLIRTTPSYRLYQRHGRTPFRVPAEPPDAAGAVFDCSTPRGQQYLKAYPWAGVLPAPVITDAWRGSIAKPGETARLRVKLPRGRWDVSLQYVSLTGLQVKGPGLNKKIAPNYQNVVTYWPAGTVTSTGAPVTVSVTSDQRSWFGQLIGKPRPTRAPLSPNDTPIWHAAFTRHGETPRRVPSKSACGRYVDWFAPSWSGMRGRSGGSR